MPQSNVNVDVRNNDGTESVKVVAAIIIDPATGLPTGNGGGGGSTDLTPVLNAITQLQNQIKMPSYASVTAISVASNGANWAVFGSQACEGFDLINDTGTAIEYRRNGGGVAITIPAGSSRLITGITNANVIGVRRVDQNATAVTIKGEAFKQ